MVRLQFFTTNAQNAWRAYQPGRTELKGVQDVIGGLTGIFYCVCSGLFMNEFPDGRLRLAMRESKAMLSKGVIELAVPIIVGTGIYITYRINS